MVRENASCVFISCKFISTKNALLSLTLLVPAESDNTCVVITLFMTRYPLNNNNVI